jgi:hypothetical protein
VPSLDAIVEGLTGLNLGSLGLRSLPKLEARKGKKNGTAVATGVSAVATGKAAAKAVSSLPGFSKNTH